MKLYRGNTQKVLDDAKIIVEQLRKSGCSIIHIQRQYHCGYPTVIKAILSVISKTNWHKITKAKLAAGGIKTRWGKGHQGTYRCPKGFHISPTTEFKKGQLPINHKPVGSVRITPNHGKKFRFIKIAKKNIWQPFAKFIYEKEIGALPAGQFIVHIDGNTLNDSPENLRAVDRAGHIALQMKRDPGMRQRCMVNNSKAQKRRWAKYRPFKEDKQIRKAIEEFAGPKLSWWECTGCGVAFDREPKGVCRKCNSIRFIKITQRKQAG